MQKDRERMKKMTDEEFMESKEMRPLKKRIRMKERRTMKRMNELNKDFAENVFQCSYAPRSLKSRNSDNEVIKNIENDLENTSSDLDMSDKFSDSEYEESNSFNQVDDNLKPKNFNSCQRYIIGNFMNQDVCTVSDMILEVHRLKWTAVTGTFAKNCMRY